MYLGSIGSRAELAVAITRTAGSGGAVEDTMSSMALAIGGLVVAWTLQGFATFRQAQHYSNALADATATWRDGFVGTGRAKSRFGAGSILLIVVDPDRVVRLLLMMRGMTVFARFARLREAEGMPLAALADAPALRGADLAALKVAMEQIDRAAAKAA